MNCRWLAAFLAAFALSGCEERQPNVLDNSGAAIGQRLLLRTSDFLANELGRPSPEMTQLRIPWTSSEPETICGFVRAPRSEDGRVVWRAFLFHGSDGRLYILEHREPWERLQSQDWRIREELQRRQCPVVSSVD